MLETGGHYMAGVNEAGRRIVLILVFGMLASFAMGATAFAQAGATGGTIARTNNSISGGDEPQKIQSMKKPLQRADTGSRCDKVIGSWTWRWLNDSAVVTLSPDGVASATNGNKGNWTCTGRAVVVNWPLGPDALTLSSDAKILTGKGAMGISVTGTRLQP